LIDQSHQSSQITIGRQVNPIRGAQIDWLDC
jgi:hypothetical protein